MKKLIVSVLILCLLMLPVYADEITTTESVNSETEDICRIVELYAFTGTLYYCDTPTDRVVLRSVEAASTNPRAKRIAREAEYLEISLSPDAIWLPSGTKGDVQSLNSYVDNNAWFIIARTLNGNLTIPYFSFR